MEILKWEEVIRGKNFISDLGGDKLHAIGPSSIRPGRYAVWTWNTTADKTSHKLTEVSNDLEYLVKKYGIEREFILVLDSIVQSSKAPPKHLRIVK